jgi:hypothetical protein
MGAPGGVSTAAETGALVRLEVYGLRVAISGDWPEVAEELRLDFAWFQGGAPDDPADVEVEIERRPPDYDGLGEVPASFITPRNVVYQHDRFTLVDYFGQAVSMLDRPAGRVRIQGEEKHLAHEAAYQFLVSRIGEHLDARGTARLHGLGLSGADGGVVLMLPSGGGKSTHALIALRDDGVKLISEDSPLLDRRGLLHPFPLRIGINPTDAASLPEGHVRRIERLEFHPKLAIELEAFADRIESEPQPLRHIVLGTRTLGRSAKLEPVGRADAVGTLFREVVVGVGIYQGMEFVLQRGMRDVLGKAGTAFQRAACCFAGLSHAKVWRLSMGRDQERNWQELRPLLLGPDADSRGS